MVKISTYTTILTYSACKGTTFFLFHKRLQPKNQQNMLHNIILDHFAVGTLRCRNAHRAVRTLRCRTALLLGRLKSNQQTSLGSLLIFPAFSL